MARGVLLLVLSLATPSVWGGELPSRQIGFLRDYLIPHIVAGGPQWQTTFIFHNPTPRQEKFYLWFFDDKGEPMFISIQGQTRDWILVTVPPNHTLMVSTDYRPDLPQQWGSALIGAKEGCYDCRFVGTTVHTIFSQYDWQRHVFLNEATVPQEGPAQSIRLIYDQTAGYVMGVALVNPSTYGPVDVRAEVHAEDGSLLRVDVFTLPRLGHTAFVLSERYPETAGRAGYVEFGAYLRDYRSNPYYIGLAGIGLRFSPSGTFTSMHMIDVLSSYYY